jgi:hypothetical protein
MAKHGSKIGKGSGGSTWIKRDPGSGQLSVGRKTFASISAVEGITITREMDAEFRRTDGMTADKRRAALARKYGKKK